MASDGVIARAGEMRPPMPVPIAVLSCAVGTAAALPLLYLVLRALGAGTEIWMGLLTPRMGEIMSRSLLLVAAVAAVAVMLGLPLAWLTTRTDLPFRQAWLVLATLPLVVPTYVGGLVLVLGLGPKGQLQRLLEPLGVERLPEIYGFPGALLVLGLHTYPYVLLNARAALLRLDPSVEEASYSLGRGRWETFRRIVLPQLRPAVAAGALLAALYTLGDFGAVSLLNYETFTWAIFIQYQSAFDRSVAAALSLVLVLMAAIILVAEARTRPSWRHGRVGLGRRRGPLRLGHWRWAAVAFCAVPLLLGVVLPVALLSAWAIQATAAGEVPRSLGRAALNSVGVAALAALLTVAAALPLAILNVRFPGRLSGLLERTTYVGFALPRIAIALGLVFFGASYARPLYQTVGLLIVAYVILFVPTALGSLSAALRQVHPPLEEAARGLGRSPRQVLLSVTLPRIWPGVLAGVALVFLLTMEELPATLILRPAGLDTLATAVWSAATEALFTEAAIPALLLALVSAFSIALLYRREEPR
jgi:iron(III) transport system permease protein